jgi:hypothetical protein
MEVLITDFRQVILTFYLFPTSIHLSLLQNVLEKLSLYYSRPEYFSEYFLLLVDYVVINSWIQTQMLMRKSLLAIHFVIAVLIHPNYFLNFPSYISVLCVFYENNLKIILSLRSILSGFSGLEDACWPLVPKFASSNPTEAVRFLTEKKKSPALLPSERK